jgi:hypothetical protein
MDMRKINLTIILALIFGSPLFSGCQSLEPKPTAPPEVLAEFEYSGDTGHIILPITFQGQEYPFVLDTAGTDTAFDDSFKDKLGKRFLWPLKGRGAKGQMLKVEWYRRYDCYLGPLDLDDHGTIKVIDLDKLIPEKNRKFQGIIGLDFLKKYIVQIDFDNGKVSFFEGKKEFDIFSFLKSKENKHPEWGEPIPMKTKFRSGLRYVEGTLFNNVKVEFLVDTGWLGPDSLKTRIFDKVYTQKDPNVKSSVVKSPLTGSSDYNIIRKFSVGPFGYKNNIFRRSNRSVLGLWFLSRHLVTFDFPNKIMYLKKGKNFDKSVSINILLGDTGCTIIAPDYIVSHVDPNGAAYKKGIREKDVLIKINNHNISSLDVVEFMELPISVPKNGVLILTFKRGNDIINTSFSEKDTIIKKRRE